MVAAEKIADPFDFPELKQELDQGIKVNFLISKL